MAFIEIGIGEFPAICIIRSVDSKSIEGITKQCRLACGMILNARTEVVIMIVTALLGMAAALILHFMRRSVAAPCIEGAEDQNT